MPKIDSVIPSANADTQLTLVNSLTYGKHLRAKRGTHTPLVVTDTMKRAGELMASANAHAKVILDAFKPYYKDMRDGSRWSRLVALFRKHLQNGELDLSDLFASFYFHRRRRLSAVLTRDVDVAQSVEGQKSVVVKVKSKSAVKHGRHDPDQYEQIIIAVFLDADFRATVLTESKIHLVSPDKHNEHVATFPRPAGARNVIIAMKCIHLYRKEPCIGIASALGVIKILALEGT